MTNQHSREPVVVITGGAGLIATSIAESLARDGWRTVIADLDEDRAINTASKISRSWAVRCDVTDESSVNKATSDVFQRYGRIDGIVNNAGILPVGNLIETDPQTWNRALSINMSGAFLVTRAAFPYLLESPRARVVMIGSRTWLAGGNPAYTASKAGLIGLARAVANELAPVRGTCNVIAPGPVDTPLAPVGKEAFDRWAERTPLGRNCEPEDVANAVSFFMGAGAGFITGEVLYVAGGLQMAAKL